MAESTTEQKIFEFIHSSWENYVRRLKAKFCDDHHGLMDLKAAYWAGAQSYQTAVQGILDNEDLTPEQRGMLMQKLDEGLQGFAVTLNPKRRLN